MTSVNVKMRILKLMKLHHLMMDELAEMVVREDRKSIIQAKPRFSKCLETLKVPSSPEEGAFGLTA